MEFTVSVINGIVFINGFAQCEDCYDPVSIGRAVEQWLLKQNNN